MDVAAVFQVKNEVRIFRFIMFVVTLLLAIYSYVVFADNRVSDKIYTNLQSNHYCNRRLNSTDQMGCTSELGGNHGVVWKITDDSDLDHVLNTGSTPPYVVIMTPNHYSRKVLLDFRDKIDRVAGVVLINGPTALPDRPFSPQDTCPNRHSGLYANDSNYDCNKYSWIKPDVEPRSLAGLLYDNIPYPIFYINDQNSTTEIDRCFEKNHYNDGKNVKKIQNSYPLCGMQLDSFMLAAKNVETCSFTHSPIDELLQSSGSRCINVENKNIFAYYNTSIGYPNLVNKTVRPAVSAEQSIVLLTAKLSSLSMFTDISPGADSTITSIVTLLAVADALNNETLRKGIMNSNKERNIAFAFFDSEPFDYLGSSTLTYSMKNNRFPSQYLRMPPDNLTEAMKNIDIKSIDYVIDLDQLATYSDDSEIYVHFDPTSSKTAKYDKMRETLSKASKDLKLVLNEEASLPLPPSSVQQFLTHSRAENTGLLGIVMSNYRDKFRNQYYHSIFDNINNIKYIDNKSKLVEHLAKIASVIARSAYKLAFDQTHAIQTDRKLIDDLLNCYLIDANCGLFTRVWNAGQSLPSGPVMTYRDPARRPEDMNGAITSNLLSYFLRKETQYNATECARLNVDSYIYNYNYVNGKDQPVQDAVSGLCIQSQAISIPYLSPGYVYQSDGTYTVSKNYTVWSVSLDNIRNPVRIFMIPSQTYQWVVFLTGIVITLVSFKVVNRFKDALSSLENEPQPSGTPT